MTKPQQTYIYSDAECVLHWIKDYPTWISPGKGAIEQAKQTAVRFADQDEAYNALCSKTSNAHKYKMDDKVTVHLGVNTIFTIEGYEVKEIITNQYSEYGDNGTRAILKRIDPVVEQDNDGWLNYPQNKPTEYGKYEVYRSKCSKQHYQTWNGSGWAYDGNTITHFRKITPPKQ